MTTQSVDRALTVLDGLAAGPRSLSDCARMLDVNKSTALRLLQTMEQRGYVAHDDRHRYRLGRQVFAVAQAALAQWDVRMVARPHLERLNAQTGQTVHLAVRDGGDVVYVDKLEAHAGIRMYSRIGLTAPLHATAVAKVLIAALPEADRRAVAGGIDYAPFTDRTITRCADYLAELRGVAARGYATDRREHESFVNCVAAPIHDGSGAVIAAASLSVPTVSLDEQGVRALLPLLLRATADISADLGWSGAVTAASPEASIRHTTTRSHPA